MKTLTISIFVMCFHSAFAQEPFSIGWLRKGLAEAVEMDKGVPDFKRVESLRAINCSLYFQGFLNATNQWAPGSEGYLKSPPDDWLKGFEAHKSFVNYLEGFEEQYDVIIPPSMNADMFIATWYNIKHPTTTPTLAHAIDLMLYKTHFNKKNE